MPSTEEKEVVKIFFDEIFNKFYKNNEGVDWSKIKIFENGIEMVKLNIDIVTGGTSKELISDILSLNIYHKNILTNLMINIASAQNKISKEAFSSILKFLEDAGLPPAADLDLVSKMKNKTGKNPFEFFDLSNNEEQIIEI